MIREYHYLISSLPELFYDKKGKPLDFDFYLNELKLCLHPDDFNSVKYLLYETDNENLLNLILEKNRPFITGGYFSKDELTNEIKYPNKLPDYMKEFISYYNSENSKSYAEIEKYLYNLYYDFMISTKILFFKSWFEFKLNLKNIIIALRADDYGYKPGDEMRGDKSVTNEIVTCLEKNYDLNHIFPNYKKIIQILNHKDILDRERQIDKIRWDFLNELILFKYFTIEVIFSYTLKLKILRRWEDINKEKGEKQFNEIINELQKSVNI